VKSIYLIPGFLASDLGILATGQVLWWDVNLAAVLGIGGMRLAPNGVDPGPPDGFPIGVDPHGQSPWPGIKTILGLQLDPATWRIAIGPYDWRKDLKTAATSLAANIRANSTAAEPATIVGHSAGGIVAVLAWAQLNASGDTAKVRRIISICTPFQGSYGPLQWLLGISPSIQQLLALSQWGPGAAPTFAFHWSLSFLNELALTWPAFYELYPALGGTEAQTDPARAFLYQASNYGAPTSPSQTWLDFVRLSFQPGLAGPDTFPPDWVMTCVVASGLATPFMLNSRAVPLQLAALGVTSDGDSVVTVGSQTRSPALIYSVTGNHASVPLAITTSGLLAKLILDPRGPVTPPSPSVVVLPALPDTVTDAPESDYISGLVCIGGG
jgi:pimeloyl-ACP methyl ester carboxylesterase